MIKGLNEVAEIIHQEAVSKGFWDEPRETGTLLMLCVSELGEALEADRKGRYANLDKYEEYGDFQANIKDTFEDEIADTIIRLLDLVAAKNIDIEKHILYKFQYNQTRGRKHGKNY